MKRPLERAVAGWMVEAAATGARASSIAKAVVDWYASRQQFSQLPRLAHALDVAWKARYGVSSVRVTCATELPETHIARLQKAVRGASVDVRVDPTLIGGARVQIDDDVMDGSVAGQLDRLSKQMKRI